MVAVQDEHQRELGANRAAQSAQRGGDYTTGAAQSLKLLWRIHRHRVSISQDQSRRTELECCSSRDATARAGAVAAMMIAGISGASAAGRFDLQWSTAEMDGEVAQAIDSRLDVAAGSFVDEKDVLWGQRMRVPVNDGCSAAFGYDE